MTLFRGSTNRIRCYTQDGKTLLSWRHRNKTVRRTCADRSEAFNIVRATFPLANITSNT